MGSSEEEEEDSSENKVDRASKKSEDDEDEDDDDSVVHAKTSSSSSSETEDEVKEDVEDSDDEEEAGVDSKKVVQAEVEPVQVENGQTNGLEEAKEAFVPNNDTKEAEAPFASFVSHQVAAESVAATTERVPEGGSAFRRTFFESIEPEEMDEDELELSKRETVHLQDEPDFVAKSPDDDLIMEKEAFSDNHAGGGSSRPIVVGPGGDIPSVSIQSGSSPEESESDTEGDEGDASKDVREEEEEAQSVPRVLVSSPELQMEPEEEDEEEDEQDSVKEVKPHHRRLQ